MTLNIVVLYENYWWNCTQEFILLYKLSSNVTPSLGPCNTTMSILLTIFVKHKYKCWSLPPLVAWPFLNAANNFINGPKYFLNSPKHFINSPKHFINSPNQFFNSPKVFLQLITSAQALPKTANTWYQNPFVNIKLNESHQFPIFVGITTKNYTQCSINISII